MAFAIKEYDMVYNQLLTDFAAEGMGFQRVFGDELGWSYAEYLLLTHLLCATEAYSVFDGEEFIGAIFYDKTGGKKTYDTPEFRALQKRVEESLTDSLPADFKSPYRRIVEFIDSYFNNAKIDGAIIFLASDIHHSPRGIGSALLEKVESKHKGEYVALMTDSNCTVPFYEHRGFQCVKKEVIPTPAQDDYTCYIYTKTM